MKRIKVLEAFFLGIATFTWLGFFSGIVMAQDEEPQFTTDFRLEDCKFRTKGENPFFILKPGYQLVLEGEEDEEEVRVVITVLRGEKEKIFIPDIGVVIARVVEERESVDGDLVEVSRNFFAICENTNDVFYFGEDVDICEDGSLVQDGNGFLCNGEEPSHEGAWRAGEPDDDGLAEPGIIMPGTFLLGSRYFQEIADGIALDRVEHVAMGLEVSTPAGEFERCVEVLETTPLDPEEESVKRYCPGVGLVFDNGLELVDFGFNINDDD
ncbi:MAG TPA: hypothetical protein VHT73_13925 [Thermodesulfobacteriota bacterium]|nr:hypothetical protein [Thermodesulfobacteriota bacterium]